MKQYSFITSIDSKINYEPRKGNRLGSVEIRSEEGDGIPHLHITSNKLGGKICLRLDKAMYFTHNKEFPDKFNSTKSKKSFNTWLDSKYLKNTEVTNWEFLRDRWNVIHKYSTLKKLVLVPNKHPDYTKLP